MKKYRSSKEGKFIEILPVELTEEQENLLKDTSSDNMEAKRTLLEDIKSQRERDIDSEDLTNNLVSFYNSVKPEIGQDDEYQLIAISIMEIKDDEYRGILNCRINGQHKQIRF